MALFDNLNKISRNICCCNKAQTGNINYNPLLSCDAGNFANYSFEIASDYTNYITTFVMTLFCRNNAYMLTVSARCFDKIYHCIAGYCEWRMLAI